MVPLNLDSNKKETNGSVKTVASRIKLLDDNHFMAINIDNICAIAHLKSEKGNITEDVVNCIKVDNMRNVGYDDHAILDR